MPKSLPLSTTYSHPRDSAIQFDASKHVYTINGSPGYTSVTTWVGSLFPSFDPDLVITKMMASKKWPRSPYFGKTRQNNYHCLFYIQLHFIIRDL